MEPAYSWIGLYMETKGAGRQVVNRQWQPTMFTSVQTTSQPAKSSVENMTPTNASHLAVSQVWVHLCSKWWTVPEGSVHTDCTDRGSLPHGLSGGWWGVKTCQRPTCIPDNHRLSPRVSSHVTLQGGEVTPDLPPGPTLVQLLPSVGSLVHIQVHGMEGPLAPWCGCTVSIP